MYAKTQISFRGIIGTNNDKIDQDKLAGILLELELDFNNKHPRLRLHVFDDDSKDKK